MKWQHKLEAAKREILQPSSKLGGNLALTMEGGTKGKETTKGPSSKFIIGMSAHDFMTFLSWNGIMIGSIGVIISLGKVKDLIWINIKVIIVMKDFSRGLVMLEESI